MELGLSAFQQLVVDPLRAAWNQLITFVPTILGALCILLIGGIIAKGLENLIVRVLKTVTLDKIMDEVGFASLLTKGGIRRKLSELIGAIVYWIVMLAFVMTALNALGLAVSAEWLQKIIDFLPKVVASLFILIVGVFAAVFLAATVRTTASNAGILQSHLLAQAVKTVTVIFAVVTALKQLEIQLVSEVFLIILAGVSLGCALAFGLGCRELAGKWAANLIDELQTKKR